MSSQTRWKALGWIALAQVLGMSLWFSRSAVLPSFKILLGLGPTGEAWLTISVQLGFVLGAFFSAFFNMADLLNTKRFFAGSLVAGSVLNALIIFFPNSFTMIVVVWFLTGVSLAGVYPPAMKLVTGWFEHNRGVAIGVLIGALTIGSASPHLIRSFGSLSWEWVLLASSLLALTGVGIILRFVEEGPYSSKARVLNLKLVGELIMRRPLRLANYGYLGRMWELYAMWAWIPFFLDSSFQKRGEVTGMIWSSSFWGFTVISVGMVGCLFAGVMADRWGRTRVAGGALGISGMCCLAVGTLWGGPELWLVLVCLIWGVSVVADSAQFSAMASELVPSESIGTALTLQTSFGFLLTIGSVWLLPYIRNVVGWEYTFFILAPGPLLGVWAMFRLHQLPQASRISLKKA
jgi:MFS family permease